MRRKAQKEHSPKKTKRKSSQVKLVNGFGGAGTVGEGGGDVFLASFPEQTGTPVLFDRDIFTLQTLSAARRTYHFEMKKSKYMLLVNN